MSFCTDLTHSITEEAEVEHNDEDMPVSEGTRIDPLRSLTDSSAVATRDSNLWPVPPIVISSDEAPKISVHFPRYRSHDMPRRATSAQPVRCSPRLGARAAASAIPPTTEPASPPDEISKDPASTERRSVKSAPPTRPTEPTVPNRPTTDNTGGPNSDSPDMSEEDPHDQEIHCEALDTWFPVPSPVLAAS